MELNQSPLSEVEIRRQYTKPHIEIVALRPKETVLGICQNTSLSSNVGFTGNDCYTGPTFSCLDD